MTTRLRRLGWTMVGLIGVIGVGLTVANAEQIWAGGYGRTPPRFLTPTTFAGSFNFCRVMFTSDRREKRGRWRLAPGAAPAAA